VAAKTPRTAQKRNLAIGIVGVGYYEPTRYVR
jgi:hypothetical protein